MAKVRTIGSIKKEDHVKEVILDEVERLICVKQKPIDIRMRPQEFIKAYHFMFGRQFALPLPPHRCRKSLEELLMISLPAGQHFKNGAELVQQCVRSMIKSKRLTDTLRITQHPLPDLSLKDLSIRMSNNEEVTLVNTPNCDILHVVSLFRMVSLCSSRNTLEKRYWTAVDLAEKDQRFVSAVKKEEKDMAWVQSELDKWVKILDWARSAREGKNIVDAMNRQAAYDELLKDADNAGPSVRSAGSDMGELIHVTASDDNQEECEPQIIETNDDNDDDDDTNRVNYQVNASQLSHDWKQITDDALNEEKKESSCRTDSQSSKKFASSREFMQSLPISKWHICPLSGQVMKNPVIACDHITYEAEAWKEWVREHDESPVINLKLSSKDTKPNLAIKAALSLYI